MAPESKKCAQESTTTEDKNGEQEPTTTEAKNGAQEFVFGDWISEGVEGMKAQSREKTEEILPEDFRTHIKESRKHMRTARKEFLMAMRSLVDAALKKVEAEPEPPKKAVKIKVE